MPPRAKSSAGKSATPEYTLDMIVEPTEQGPLDMEMIRKVTQNPDPCASNNIRVAIRVLSVLQVSIG